MYEQKIITNLVSLIYVVHNFLIKYCKQMNLIFLGTPDFAIPSLEALLNTSWINVLAVCTQTDKPANRGKHLTPPPIKTFAQEKGITIFQTKSIAKEKEIIEKIKMLKADVMVSCSFGQILSQEILDIAPVINVHASLLPKYRGAAPINFAILNGEKETGVTIMLTELAVDSGPIILQEKCAVEENETSVELFHKLSKLGANTLIKALELIRDKKVIYKPQEHEKATFAPMLKKEMGLINWGRSSLEIHNQIRGLQPWPSAYTRYNDKIIKIWESRIIKHSALNYEPGTITEIKDNLTVKTGDSLIEIYKLQPENKKILNAKDWVNGSHAKVGDKFV